MKKIISLLVVVALMAACLATVAFAADTATITVSSEETAAGKEVTLEVSIENNPGFAAFNITLDYDKDALELVELKQGALITAGMYYGYAETGKSAYANTANLTGDGVLFTATFKVIAEGEHTVKAVVERLGTADMENIAYTTVDGVVSVAHACKLVDVAEVPATCTTDGVKAHQKCEVCGKLYLNGVEVDAADLVIPGGHTFSEWSFDEDAHWYVCSVCGETCDHGKHVYEKSICSICGYDSNPDSGDMSAIVFALAALSCTGLVTMTAKKKED